MSNFPSASLLNLENQLHHDLETILDQEMDLWMLKSRVNWMIQGDCNTSFYHTSTLARRKRNHIASVMDDRGEWITNIREVTEFFHRGFFSLYAISHESTSHIPHQTV